MTQSNAEAIIEAAVVRNWMTLPFYFICGIMESLTAYQRALGSSLRPMVITLFSVCVFRVAWAKIVFPLIGGAVALYAVYPLSWLICTILHLLFSVRLTRKIIRTHSDLIV